MEEVNRHNKPNDCWIVLHGTVYNVTEFHEIHPGGSKLIMLCAGKDGTAPFSEIHPRDLPQKLLRKEYIIGKVDPKTIKEIDLVAPMKTVEESKYEKPAINKIINTFDFENIARYTMSKEGWGYYSSGAEDEMTLRENRVAFQRVWMKPRILRNVKVVDVSTNICGFKSSIPLYISATALGKLAHPDGELALVRAAANTGIPYMLPTLSSYSVDEMLEARTKDQILFSQIYVNVDRQVTYDYINHLDGHGVKAIFITVDAPQLGRREKDMRNKFQQQGAHVQGFDSTDRSQGVARAISSFIDHSLDWEGLQEIKKRTKLPIYLKGIQTGEDAVLAYEAGVQGLVVSNHGGRQLDLSRSGLEILPEVMAALRKIPTYSKEKFHVFLDGGVRRGTDIYKALALGATAVGIGRPALYALASYGQEGVEYLINNVFHEEFENCMQQMGTTHVDEISEKSVITKNLTDHIAPVPTDWLTTKVYEPMDAILLKEKSKL